MLLNEISFEECSLKCSKQLNAHELPQRSILIKSLFAMTIEEESMIILEKGDRKRERDRARATKPESKKKTTNKRFQRN